MAKLQINQHISNEFNSSLEGLRTDFLEMGGMVEQQLVDATHAIETADIELAEKVLKIEESVDSLEVKIDAECMDVLALRQPAASDLRLVMVVSKAIRDLERMGDEAQKIANMARALHKEVSNQEASRAGYVELRHLASSVREVVRLSLDAFARYDVQSALNVVRQEQVIDIDYKSAMRELITHMMEDPRSISRAMNMMWALRSLERIGDHARNIAEHVIYLVKGKDVRHSSIVDIEKQLGQKRSAS